MCIRDRQNEAARREKQYETFTMLHDLVSILAGITLVFVFFFRLVGVDGSSMYPTLVDHDYLVLESNFLYRSVRAGDIVVIDPPEEAGFSGPIVKRVIATGGQTVDIDFDAGVVYVLSLIHIFTAVIEGVEICYRACREDTLELRSEGIVSHRAGAAEALLLAEQEPVHIEFASHQLRQHIGLEQLERVMIRSGQLRCV